jgi:hypothetical protein
MSTLKVKNANGQWDLVQLTGEDVTNLKSDVSSLTSQLAQIATQVFYVKKYCVGNGTTDDSDNLLSLVSEVNALPETTNAIIEFNVPSLLLTKPIYFYKSNVDLRFNNCKINWNGTANLNNSTTRMIGVFNFRGSTLLSETVTSFNPIGTDGIAPVSDEGCYVVTSNNANFNQGDFVELNLNTGVQSNSTLSPRMKILTKITRIANGNIYLNYANPFDFSGKTITGTLTKVDPLENIRISDFRLYDIVPATRQANASTSYDTTARNTFVSGLSFVNIANSEIKKVYAENTKFPVIITDNVYKLNASNLELYKPNIIGGGEGYLVQLNSALFCTIDTTFGNEERHNVDFTASAYCKVINGKSFNSMAVAFNLHGKYEHNIEFVNCIGNFDNGSGLTDFGDAVKNIKYDNCKGTLSSDHAQNVEIVNSDVKLSDFYAYATIIKNSTVKLYRNRTLTPTKRGLTGGFIKFIDCDVYSWSVAVDALAIVFDGYDTVSIEGGTYDVVKPSGVTNMIRFQNTSNIIVSRNKKLSNFYGDINATSIEVNLKVDGNTFSGYPDAALIMFRLQNLTTAKLHLIATGNTVRYTGTNLARWFRITNTTTFLTDCALTVNFAGNTLISDVQDSLSLLIHDAPQITRSLYGNVLKGAKAEGITNAQITGTNTIVTA